MAQPDEIKAQRELSLIRDKRDEAAFARLYDTYSAILYRVCLLILKSEAEAQEALQDAFLHVWEKPAGYDPARGKLYTWLNLLTRSKAIDRLRKNARLNKKVALTSQGNLEWALGRAESKASGALDMSLDSERRRQVLGLLASLPQAQAQVLKLAFFGGLSQSEIALKVRRPLGTVKTQMRAALKKLSASATPEMRSWL